MTSVFFVILLLYYVRNAIHVCLYSMCACWSTAPIHSVVIISIERSHAYKWSCLSDSPWQADILLDGATSEKSGSRNFDPWSFRINVNYVTHQTKMLTQVSAIF